MRQKGLFLLALFLIMPITVFADSLITKEAIVVESFDGEGLTNNGATGNPVVWKVFGSKFITTGYPKQAYANAFPEDLFGKNPENEADLKSFAILGSFTRKGYNYLEIMPGEGTGTDWKAEPLMLPGKVEFFDLWVWGSNFDYTLEMHVVDYQGIVHVIEMGSIKHIGWKHLYVKIPAHIKQTKQYLPFFEGLKLTKLVVRTDPEERVDQFYLYIDQLKVLTDTHIYNFDGEDLTNKAKIEEIWGGSDAQ
ncbi:MAG: flagellar filament outer layer protein FlaA [Spirochaetales bacterium]|nr:flagellar filament outer layer protein FlaA [Spirochaetales bacterium]